MSFSLRRATRPAAVLGSLLAVLAIACAPAGAHSTHSAHGLRRHDADARSGRGQRAHEPRRDPRPDRARPRDPQR